MGIMRKVIKKRHAEIRKSFGQTELKENQENVFMSENGSVRKGLIVKKIEVILL